MNKECELCRRIRSALRDSLFNADIIDKLAEHLEWLHEIQEAKKG